MPIIRLETLKSKPSTFCRFLGPGPDFPAILVAGGVDLGVVVHLVRHDQPLLQLRRQRRRRRHRRRPERRVNRRATLFLVNVDAVRRQRQRRLGAGRRQLGVSRRWDGPGLVADRADVRRGLQVDAARVHPGVPDGRRGRGQLSSRGSSGRGQVRQSGAEVPGERSVDAHNPLENKIEPGLLDLFNPRLLHGCENFS